MPRIELVNGDLDRAVALVNAEIAEFNWSGPGGAGAEVLGAYDGQDLVACLHWSTRPVAWFGEHTVLGQAGPGATAPSHRGRGIMRALLWRVLNRMRERGLALAGQQTPIVDYHRRTGWELVSYERSHRLDGPLRVPAAAPPCRPVAPAAVPALHGFWNRTIAGRPLASWRVTGDWTSLTDGATPLVAAGQNGTALGYARGLRPGPAGGCRIGELVAVDAAATAALLAAAAEATPGSPPGPIEWWSPPGDGNDLRPALGPQVHGAVVYDKMLRVVDAGAVLGRIAALCPDASAARVRVLDPLCAWNHRDFAFGTGTAADRPDLTVDVRTLARLAAGVVASRAFTAHTCAGAALIERLAVAFDRYRACPAWLPDPM